MSWRPWLISTLLLASLLINGALVYNERIPVPTASAELVRVEERPRHIQYLPQQRRANFIEMGMDDDLASAVASQIDRLKGKKPKFVKMLQEQAADVSVALCPSDRVPQPYAMLRYLAYEENEKRYVFEVERLILLEEQEWYAQAPVETVYNKLEVTPTRKAEATLMGVAALLLGREIDVLEGNSPWSQGLMGSWGWKRLKKEEPRVERLVIEYFSLMHFLTELANTRDGICS